MRANATSGVAVSVQCFKELRTGRAHRFVVFKVDDAVQQVVVDIVGPWDGTFEDLPSSLPADGCRYAADVKSKMAYASSNEVFKKELDGVVQIDLQATEPGGLTLDVLKDHAS